MSSIIGGTKTSGSGTSAQQSSTQFQQQDINALRQQQQALQGQTAGVTNLAGQLGQQAQQAGVPQLRTQFGGPAQIQTQGPQFSNQLDQMSRGLVSQGTQALNQQAAAQQRGIAQQFAGQPGIAQALGRQAAMQSRLQANPLLLQAAQQQSGREIGQQQLIQSSQDAANQARLAQTNQGLNINQASNQALLQQQQAGQANRQEQLGFGQAGLNANQGLLASLSALAQQFGTQNQTGQTQQTQRSGGIMQNFGIK